MSQKCPRCNSDFCLGICAKCIINNQIEVNLQVQSSYRSKIAVLSVSTDARGTAISIMKKIFSAFTDGANNAREYKKDGKYYFLLTLPEKINE